MAKAIIPAVNEKDARLMEAPLSAGHIEYKYAVRLKSALSRARGVSTTNIALALGIDLNSVSGYAKRYNEGGVESLLSNQGKPPYRQSSKTR